MAVQKRKYKKGEEISLLCFWMGGHRYATPLEYFKEIVQYRELTKVPFMSEWYEGVLNLRGKVITVIDLRKKLKMEPASERPIILLCDLPPYYLGAVVDGVDGVQTIYGNDLELIESPMHPGVTHRIEEKDRETFILSLSDVLEEEMKSHV